MPSATYRLLWQALRERRQLAFRYHDLPRVCCPVILGYAADGRAALFAYQFAGATSGRSKLPQWRCFYVETIRDLQAKSGAWHEGTSHKQAQTCVRFVDVDVNVPDTLNAAEPLPFGSDALRPPQRG